MGDARVRDVLRDREGERRLGRPRRTVAAGGLAGTEVGWGIVRDRCGLGYATEAATAAIDWAFDALGWSEVIHVIDVGNAASQAVARKLGSRNRGRGQLPAPYEAVVIDVWGQTRAEWRARPLTRLLAARCPFPRRTASRPAVFALRDRDVRKSRARMPVTDRVAEFERVARPPRRISVTGLGSSKSHVTFAPRRRSRRREPRVRARPLDLGRPCRSL